MCILSFAFDLFIIFWISYTCEHVLILFFKLGAFTKKKGIINYTPNTMINPHKKITTKNPQDKLHYQGSPKNKRRMTPPPVYDYKILKELGVRLGKSKLGDHAGYGVFATRNYKEGENIFDYRYKNGKQIHGEEIPCFDKTEFIKKYPNEDATHVLEVNKKYYDAIDYGLGGKCNTNPSGQNTRFNKYHLQAARKIFKGEELYVPYDNSGKHYKTKGFFQKPQPDWVTKKQEEELRREQNFMLERLEARKYNREQSPYVLRKREPKFMG